MAKLLKSLVVVAFVIGVALAIPLALIHSLNQLFPVLNIPYEFRTWIAMFMLWVFFGSHFRNDAKQPARKKKVEQQ